MNTSDESVHFMEFVLKNNGSWTIIDVEYHAQLHARRPKPAKDDILAKAERDFLNMEVYGLLLHAHLSSVVDDARNDIALEFWVPGESDTVEPMNRDPAWESPLSIMRLDMHSALETYALPHGH